MSCLTDLSVSPCMACPAAVTKFNVIYYLQIILNPQKVNTVRLISSLKNFAIKIGITLYLIIIISYLLH